MPSLGSLSITERWRLARLATAVGSAPGKWDQDPLDAVFSLEAAVARFPREWLGFYMYANYALELDDPEYLGSAIFGARRANELAPNDPRTAFALATALRMAAQSGEGFYGVRPGLLMPSPSTDDLPGDRLDEMVARMAEQRITLAPSDALVALAAFQKALALGLRGKDQRVVQESIEAVERDLDEEKATSKSGRRKPAKDARA